MPSRRTLLAGAGAVAAGVPASRALAAIPPTVAAPARILTIGDSIMGGPGNPLPADTSLYGPRAELHRLLDLARVPHVLADRSIIGSRVPDHTPKAARYVADTNPDIVLIALGTNHCTVEATDNDFWWFQSQYRDLVAALRAAKTGMKIVGSLIEYSTLPNMPADRTNREHSINGWVDDLHVDKTLDGLAHFDEIAEFNLGPDGIHPKPCPDGRDWSGYDVYGVKMFHALAPLLALPAPCP